METPFLLLSLLPRDWEVLKVRKRKKGKRYNRKVASEEGKRALAFSSSVLAALSLCFVALSDG